MGTFGLNRMFFFLSFKQTVKRIFETVDTHCAGHCKSPAEHNVRHTANPAHTGFAFIQPNFIVIFVSGEYIANFGYVHPRCNGLVGQNLMVAQFNVLNKISLKQSFVESGNRRMVIFCLCEFHQPMGIAGVGITGCGITEINAQFPAELRNMLNLLFGLVNSQTILLAKRSGVVLTTSFGAVGSSSKAR